MSVDIVKQRILQQVPLSSLSKIMAKTKSLLVITGAGISVPSGIQPYRGSNGRYTQDPGLQNLMTADTWQTDPNAIWREVNRRRCEIHHKLPN